MIKFLKRPLSKAELALMKGLGIGLEHMSINATGTDVYKATYPEGWSSLKDNENDNLHHILDETEEIIFSLEIESEAGVFFGKKIILAQNN